MRDEAGNIPSLDAALLSRRLPSDPPGANADPPSACVDVGSFRAELDEAGVGEMPGPLLATFAEDAPSRFAARELAMKNGDAKLSQLRQS